MKKLLFLFVFLSAASLAIAEPCPHGHDHTHAHPVVHEELHDDLDHDEHPLVEIIEDDGHDHGDDELCPDTLAAEPAASLSVPPGNQELLALSFTPAIHRDIRNTLRIPGRFEWMPGAQVVYAAPVRARITLRVRPPQQVKAGEVLFTMESPEWAQETHALRTLAAEVAVAEARLQLLQQRLAALQEIGRRDAALELEAADMDAALMRTKLEFEGRRTVFAMTDAQLSEEAGMLAVRAKRDGVVYRLATETGSWLDAGGEVLSLMESGKVWFRADANTREAGVLFSGQAAFVEPARGIAAPGGQAHATLEIGLPDPQTPRITPVYAVAESLPAWAVPGRAGTLLAVTKESAAKSVAVPEACLIREGLHTYVIVKDATDATLFHKREVEPGVSDGVWTEVHGIRAGEQVVADGVYELNLAMPVGNGAGKTPAGHFHADGKFYTDSH